MECIKQWWVYYKYIYILYIISIYYIIYIYIYILYIYIYYTCISIYTYRKMYRYIMKWSKRQRFLDSSDTSFKQAMESPVHRSNMRSSLTQKVTVKCLFCTNRGSGYSIYPLVNVYIAMERSTMLLMDKSTISSIWTWPFSMSQTVRNYQRVARDLFRKVHHHPWPDLLRRHESDKWLIV